jgi:hypothetical protein
VRRALAALVVIAAAGCEDEDVPSPGQPAPDAGPGIDAGPLGIACTHVCDAEQRLCPLDKQPTCVEDCVAAPGQASDCEDELAAYIGCLGDHADELTSCLAADYPPECKQVHDAYTGCGTSTGCGVVECKDVGEDACSCDANCKGVIYTEACTRADGGSAAGAAFDCTCSANGQLDVTCPGVPTACAFFVGCCASSLP